MPDPLRLGLPSWRRAEVSARTEPIPGGFIRGQTWTVTAQGRCDLPTSWATATNYTNVLSSLGWSLRCTRVRITLTNVDNSQTVTEGAAGKTFFRQPAAGEEEAMLDTRPGAHCPTCKGPVPATRHPRSPYCSDTCRTRANTTAKKRKRAMDRLLEESPGASIPAALQDYLLIPRPDAETLLDAAKGLALAAARTRGTVRDEEIPAPLLTAIAALIYAAEEAVIAVSMTIPKQ